MLIPHELPTHRRFLRAAPLSALVSVLTTRYDLGDDRQQRSPETILTLTSVSVETLGSSTATTSMAPLTASNRADHGDAADVRHADTAETLPDLWWHSEQRRSAIRWARW